MKIGILTHYYKSANYGGNLQAYALCKVLEEMGHQPEQLQIDMVQGCRSLLNTEARWKQTLKNCIKAPLRLAARCLLPRYRKKYQWKRNTQKRLEQAFYRFNRQLTPHSAAVYTSKNIKNALACYDAFITGSDQVWNPIWYFPPFFLEFAPSTTPKLSYAASIGQTRLTKGVADRYRAHLKDFIGVSVREQDAVALLEGIAPETATWVLDPTLLLSRDQWLTVAEPTPIETPYVFCYFLGNDPVARQTAADYAKAKGLTLVTIPNATGKQNSNDRDFGDIRLEDPSPEAFLGLIDGAQRVFTDSFHATVFALLFCRSFATFPRMVHPEMSSRVVTLTGLFDAGNHFCDSPEKCTLSWQETLPDRPYEQLPDAYLQAAAVSRDFLETNLNKAKEMLL